jgi:hypothetical protein
MLIEGRVDDVRKKYGGLGTHVLDQLVAGDPSGNYKYLAWMAREVAEGFFGDKAHRKPTDVIRTVQDFHKNHQRLKVKDLYQYDEPEDVRDAVDALGLSKTQQKKETKLEGADKLYEDERFILMFMKNKDAVCHYGFGTQWCITSRDEYHFEDYTNKGILFYFLIDKTKKSHELNKVAIAVDKVEGMETDIYDEQDDPVITSEFVSFGGERPGVEIEWPDGFAGKMVAMAENDAKTREVPEVGPPSLSSHMYSFDEKNFKNLNWEWDDQGVEGDPNDPYWVDVDAYVAYAMDPKSSGYRVKPEVLAENDIDSLIEEMWKAGYFREVLYSNSDIESVEGEFSSNGLLISIHFKFHGIENGTQVNSTMGVLNWLDYNYKEHAGKIFDAIVKHGGVFELQPRFKKILDDRQSADS